MHNHYDTEVFSEKEGSQYGTYTMDSRRNANSSQNFVSFPHLQSQYASILMINISTPALRE